MTPHVHVWDPDRGQLLHRLPHTERIHHVCFHPVVPELMVTCGWGSEARIWNLATGKLVRGLKHPQWVAQIQFSADGDELITGCDDGVLRVWDWQAGKLKDGWPLLPSTVQDFRFLADHRALVLIGNLQMQMTDWRTKTPLTPSWDHRPDFDLTMEISAAADRAIVGGLGSFVAYDLDSMLTPTTASTEDVVRLAELVAGRRILSQGNIVPLSGTEWLEHWDYLQRQDASRLLEAIQPSPAVQCQRLIVSLYERLIRKSAVVRHLRDDVNLGEDLRAQAIARAEQYYQNPTALNEKAWLVVRSPDGSTETYTRALLQAEEACSLQPGNGLSLNTLGVAHYRVGNYQRAIDTLTRSEELNRLRFGNSQPADLAFLSMAQHRLGLKQQAVATFERLRQIMSDSEKAKGPSMGEDEATRNENQAFFKEAEKTIGSQHAPSQSIKEGNRSSALDPENTLLN
jgi:tetratricopeptide (TPR) repeat protein